MKFGFRGFLNFVSRFSFLFFLGGLTEFNSERLVGRGFVSFSRVFFGGARGVVVVGGGLRVCVRTREQSDV